MAAMDEEAFKKHEVEVSKLSISPQIKSEFKTVLVTGGAGFIGSNVAEQLLERGDKVIIVDEMNDYYDVRFKQANLELLYNKYGPNRCIIYRGDICDVDFISDVFEKERPTHVCHLAARYSNFPFRNI